MLCSAANGFAKVMPVPARQAGFTYLGGMVLVAILATTSATALQVGSVYRQRFDEEMLLAVGLELRIALDSYAALNVPNQPSQPARIQDLLRDPRSPGMVRHLRRLYADPMTGQAMWGEVRTLDNLGILGFYSLSKKTPVRQASFPEIFENFTGKSSYEDWVFSPTAPYALLQNGRKVGANAAGFLGAAGGGLK